MKVGVEWALRTPEQGSMSTLWSAVSEEARDAKYPQGTCESSSPFVGMISSLLERGAHLSFMRSLSPPLVDFSDPNELGMESSEAKDEELVRSFSSPIRFQPSPSPFPFLVAAVG
jgi:hypothetical protein